MGALKMLWSGKAMETVPPLEVTVRKARTRSRDSWCLALVHADGEVWPMRLNVASDLPDIWGYPSAYAARIAAGKFMADVIEQGMDVIYRSDLED